MAETTKGAKAPYATPDRDNKKNTDPAPTKPVAESKTPKTVTPLDPVPTGKHVRFNNNNKDESPKSKRGLVSRRGGRLGQGGSPAPPPPSNKDEPVLEFKTYRSPQRKKQDTDTIPSLCSASSESSNTNKKPLSISCNSKDASIDTSPLTQQSPPTALTPPKSDGDRRNVTFSPPTPHTEVIRMDTQKKTPTKSPPGGQFQSLPSLQDAKLSSPCGIFLSPTATATDPAPPVPSLKTNTGKEESNDDKKQTTTKEEQKDDDDDKKQKARDQERERAVATPTDFALDFGKGLRNTGSFDASNVLAWLQSPTANGLFSPGGGLGSALNTPRAAGMPAAAPRTPRTPTMSTSFFFSDVASLPRNAEFTSPKKPKGGPQGVYSSMICISPLASSKRKSQPQTPMNYNDVFASPRVAPEQGRPGNLPFLGDSPGKAATTRRKNSNLDADMAERDLMEDEDLSVLLQLASNANTPKGARGGGTHVFRSPRGRQKAAGYPPRPEGYDGNAPPGSNLPGLQLPVIGGRGDTSAKLARKPNEQDKNGSEDFKPPQLAIRSSSSSAGSKEILLGSEKKPATTKAKGGKGKSNAKASEKTKSKAGRKKGSSGRTGRPSAYSMPPYPHPGAEVGYYPLPGSIPPMPPGGSMRVVVGGPPPVPGGRSKGSGTGTSPPRRREGAYPMGDASYPRHPGAPLYPHHGVYPQHPHIGVPPHYPGHYPPPPPPPRHSSHLPIYSSSQRPSSRASTGGGESTKKTKATKPTKSAAKRPAPSPPAKTSPTKKPRKSPTKRKRTKVATPAPADRHKTAAAINAVNAASGKKNDKAAALAAAILRGVTMRPSGKWQAQLYYAGKSRYIGVFDTREKAALAYEIAREKLKSEKSPGDSSSQSLKATEAAVNAARKAAFEGVNEKDPRLASKK